MATRIWDVTPIVVSMGRSSWGVKSIGRIPWNRVVMGAQERGTARPSLIASTKLNGGEQGMGHVCRTPALIPLIGSSRMLSCITNTRRRGSSPIEMSSSRSTRRRRLRRPDHRNLIV